MQIDNDYFSNILSGNSLREFTNGPVGIEKENLRISDSRISKNEYESTLGSSLCNNYITTDFSESQFEFITPPTKDFSNCIEFLDSIQKFTQSKIGNDLLWPLSMPPFIESEADIPIGKYGKSNLGLFKTVYRNGLSHRYGKLMQTISGLHYNFSYPEIFFKDISKKFPEYNESEIRSEIYLATIRNIHRINWLLLYLFGCSPIVSKNFTNQTNDDFLTHNNSFYLPYATSLRMSDLGYNNSDRSDLFISINNIDEYTNDLLEATNTHSKRFADFPSSESGNKTQISPNILQIEDEYYSIARPKSSIIDESRLTSKLKTGGVDYIELRSIDLDPFTRTGISIDDLMFLKTVIIYCTFTPSPIMTKKEYNEIKSNDLLVSRMGRKKNLSIKRDSKTISLDDWACEIFDKLHLINENLGNNISMIDKYKRRLIKKDETPSGRILDNFLSSEKTMDQIGTEIAHENKEKLLKETHLNKQIIKKIEDEVSRSKKEQEKLERHQNISFSQYLDNYFER